MTAESRQGPVFHLTFRYFCKKIETCLNMYRIYSRISREIKNVILNELNSENSLFKPFTLIILGLKKYKFWTILSKYFINSTYTRVDLYASIYGTLYGTMVLNSFMLYVVMRLAGKQAV